MSETDTRHVEVDGKRYRVHPDTLAKWRRRYQQCIGRVELAEKLLRNAERQVAIETARQIHAWNVATSLEYALPPEDKRD